MDAYEKIERIIEAVARIVPTVGTFRETIMNVVRGYSEATLNSLLLEVKEIIEANSEPTSNAK